MEFFLCWIHFFFCFCFFCWGLAIWKKEKGFFMKGLAIFIWGMIPCQTIVLIQSVFM